MISNICGSEIETLLSVGKLKAKNILDSESFSMGNYLFLESIS